MSYADLSHIKFVMRGCKRLCSPYSTMCKSSVQLLRHVGVPSSPAAQRHDLTGSARVKNDFGECLMRDDLARNILT